MTVKFIEPGGDADFSNSGYLWDSANLITIVSDFLFAQHKRVIRCAGGSGAQVNTVPGSVADAGSRVSYRMYLATLPNATGSILNLRKSDRATNTVTLRLTSAGVLQLWDGAVAQIGTDGPTLVTGRFYRISIAYTITSTTVNRFEVFVNGYPVISVTNATITNTGSSCVFFGNNSSNATLDQRLCDFYIDDSAALTDTGNKTVIAKRPFANGTTNGFSTQIGAGGSGYGSGHSPQVNERALSQTNGWSMVGAGSAVTEEYSIENLATGDYDLTNIPIVDFMGWVVAKSLAGETAQIVVGGVNSNISLTSVVKGFIKMAGSTTYPAGGTDIGIITDTSLTTVSLYECGIVVAFDLPVPNSRFFDFM